MALARLHFLLVHFVLIAVLLIPHLATAQLKLNFYKDSCPNLEKIVRKAVKKKIHETFITIPATIRLYFHDCMVNGCDASIMIESTANNTAEKDHPANLSLAKEGFDTVIKVKEAVDLVPGCKDKVSCADILAIATRDVIRQFASEAMARITPLIRMGNVKDWQPREQHAANLYLDGLRDLVAECQIYKGQGPH